MFSRVKSLSAFLACAAGFSLAGVGVAEASVENCGMSSCVAGLFATQAECLQTQSNYARYYRIIVPCANNGSGQYLFVWADK